jgi:hypothetical protein
VAIVAQVGSRLPDRSTSSQRNALNKLEYIGPVYIKQNRYAASYTSKARKPGDTACTRARAAPLAIRCCGVIAPGIGIESVDLKNLENTAAAVSALDVNDEIDQIADLTLNRFIRELDVCT